jgi:LEA14-like dessication related protein
MPGKSESVGGITRVPVPPGYTWNNRYFGSVSMKPRLLALSIASALAVTACASVPRTFLDPEIQLRQVTVRGLGITGGSMDLLLDIYNPNGFDLRGTKLQLGFDVEGSHLGDITYDDEYRVDRRDTTTVTLPMRFNWAGVNAAARAALGYGDIPYTMRGQATVRTPLGDRVVAFTRQGRAPLTRSGGATSTTQTPSR